MMARDRGAGRVWRPANRRTVSPSTPISDCLADEDTLVWADVYDPDHAALAALADELGLNIWAVEDATSPTERTKATVYRTHTFFTVYAVDMVAARRRRRPRRWSSTASRVSCCRAA